MRGYCFGEVCYNWVMEYLEYLQSDLWKQRRYAALENAGFRCQLCGETDSLEVHHRTYERLGYERPDDLVVICKGHHWIEHLHRVEEVIRPCSYAIGLIRKIEKDKGSFDNKGRTTQETRNEIRELTELLYRHRARCALCSMSDIGGMV